MLYLSIAAALALLVAPAVVPCRLEIGSELVTRDDKLDATLVLGEEYHGEAELLITWRDSLERTVRTEKRNVEVAGDRVSFELDLVRAVCPQNFLSVNLVTNHATFTAPVEEFIVTLAEKEWDDYRVIMYYPYEPHLQPKLAALGINSGKLAGNQTRNPQGAAAWYPYGYRFYCDQISTFFYAAYHTPQQKPKNRLYTLAKEEYKKDRSRLEPFYRKPCLHDEEALGEALKRLVAAGRAQRRQRPIFYALCDEAGVADLVAPWDFCFDPRTIAAMREWLIAEYGSLDAINSQWETDFATLEDLRPLTTDEMMARGDDNLSPWADHRHFMNYAFAAAAAKGVEAILSGDPDAYVGLVGCQMPAAFGGYDYWLLSQALLCVEPYNIGNNREIWRSLAPEKPAVTTAFGFGDWEVWRLWYQMLHGDLGIIIYDEEFRYLDKEGRATDLGASIAPTYLELTGGIRKLLSQMRRVEDPIAIHYSQPSITAHWMLEIRPRGLDWVERESWHDRQDSRFVRLRESWVKLVEDNLRQFDFVAYAQLENGQFDLADHRIMILPQSIAMSAEECRVLRRFVERGGVLVADCRTALMDEHCKALGKGQLDDLFGITRRDLTYAPGPEGLKPVKGASGELAGGEPFDRVSAAEPGVRVKGAAVAYYEDANGTPAVIVNKTGRGATVYLNAVVTDYYRWRIRSSDGESLRAFVARLIEMANVPPQYDLTMADGSHPVGIEIHPYSDGKTRLLAIHRNYHLKSSELGPPEYQSQEALKTQRTLRIGLGAVSAVYDERSGGLIDVTDTVTVDVPEYEPVILSIFEKALEAVTIDAPDAVAAGDLVEVALEVVGAEASTTHVLRVEVLSASGESMGVYQRNLVAPGGRARWILPLAESDMPGAYTLLVRDVATGLRAQHTLEVSIPRTTSVSVKRGS